MADRVAATPPEKVEQLLERLAEARESYRLDMAHSEAERSELDRVRHEAKKLHLSARAEKVRTKKLYERFLHHMKRKWSAERKAVQAERNALTRERAELDRTAAESHEYKVRLYEAWEQLHEGQRRLLADRQQAEQWLGVQIDALDHRTTTLKQQEQQFVASQWELEQKIAALQEEIAGLDARAINARATIQQLELKQSRLLTPADGFGNDSFYTSLVPLEPTTAHEMAGGNSETLLADLHARQQDLDRVRRKIFAARDELELRSTNLDGQRAILAEQVATLVTARELWNSAEVATLAELETLTRAVRHKEQAVEMREQQLIQAEQISLERETELAKVREQLEAWRQTLVAHESAEATAREQLWQGLKTRQSEVKHREQSLGEVLQAWAGLRDQEREHYLSVVNHWQVEQERYSAATAEADRTRLHYLGELPKLAASQLAFEESIADKGVASQRRMRVLKAHWEKHFRRWQKELDARHSELVKAGATADEHRRELQKLMKTWLEERSESFAGKAARDREKLAKIPEADLDSPPPGLDEKLEAELERVREELKWVAGLFV